MGISSPILSGCLLFIFDVREDSDYSVCGCFAVDVAAEAFSGCEGPKSVFWISDFDWDMVSSPMCFSLYEVLLQSGNLIVAH